MKIFSLVLLLAACGGDSNAVDAGSSDSAKAKDAAAVSDAPTSHDGPSSDAALDAAPGGPTLKVKNYLAWCSVSVDGHAASAASEQDVSVTAGTITLVASPLSGFVLGPRPWHDTAGDTGNGDPGTQAGTGTSATSTTTVVVGASGKCVWVCCPFTDGSGCPSADQCP